jgi:type II secretory pathway pseudopilin PulG
MWSAVNYSTLLLVELAVFGALIVAALLIWVTRIMRARRSRRREEAAEVYRRALSLHRGIFSLTSAEEHASHTWLDIPLPQERKLALIAAGISAQDVFNPEIVALTDEALKVMTALTASSSPDRNRGQWW